jgi:carboxypeptidase family protein/TonB-like protein
MMLFISHMCYKNNITAGVIAGALVASLSVVPLLAQSSAGTFSGTLLDTVGRVLPHQSLTLVNVTTGISREEPSDGSGRFAFVGLDAGDFELSARTSGFGGVFHVRLAPGQNLQRDVALQIGTVQETVNVTAGPARPSSPWKPTADSLDPTGCAQGPVGGCVEPPLKLVDVRPVYPPGRGDAGATILLDGRIGVDGYVKGLRLQMPADREFVRAAIEAVNQWQFTATRVDGVPVETPIAVSVTFAPR